jgi:predicted nucleic-acid-binding protein
VRSIDTNIVLGVILRDDPVQTPVATACVEQGAFVSDGVLMETEWVLRGLYGKDRRAEINDALAAFVALDTVSVAQPDRIDWALDRHRAGADWADMLHLIASAGHDAFATFEKNLREGEAPPVPVEKLK